MHGTQKMQRSKNVLLAHWQLILFQNEETAHSSIFIKEKKCGERTTSITKCHSKLTASHSNHMTESLAGESIGLREEVVSTHGLKSVNPPAP